MQGNQSHANGGLLIGPASAGGSLTIASGATVSVAVTNQFGVTNQIQIGNTNPAGTTAVSLNVSGSVTNNGTLLAARDSVVTLNSGSTWLQNGDLEILGEGGYSGLITVAAGSTFTYTGSDLIQLNGANGNSGQALLNVEGLFITPAAFEELTSPSTGYGQLLLTNGGTLRLSAPVADLTTGGSVQFFLAAVGHSIVSLQRSNYAAKSVCCIFALHHFLRTV